MTRQVVITSLELRSIWYYFQLTFLSMHIVRQLKEFKCVGWKSTGFGRLQFTMTLWESPQDISAFMREEGPHRRAMGYSKKLANMIRVNAFPGEIFPTWKEAKRMLHENGRIIDYR